jgi:outer membrane receptor protein involved in Fe transport
VIHPHSILILDACRAGRSTPARATAVRGFVRGAALAALCFSTSVSAWAQGAQPPAQPVLPTPKITVTVVGTTPLPGIGISIDTLAAPVQIATDKDFERTGALDLSGVLNRRVNGVHLNETQGNPFQPDLNYRGYSASPLLGTPQGLSIYMDGVRLNQPFGEVVSWDLIPRLAISSVVLMPGSNPLFGLNTLGGALSIQTKDGRTAPGTTVQTIYGRDARRALEFEHGGAKGPRLDWYVTGQLFAEDGWRTDSPSDVRQIFGKLSWRRTGTDVNVTLSHADNSLTGNGLQDQQFLDRDRASVYTKPDVTDNRSTFLNVAAKRRASETVLFSGNAYFRHVRTGTLNGDINEDSLDQSVYQPGAAERAALAAAGYSGVPASGATADNTPFPFWRCIGSVLINDEPGEKCNGLINRGKSTQRTGGFAGQFTWLDAPVNGRHQLTVGGGFDRSNVDFQQSTELGYLNPDRSVTGLGAFGDGVTGGDVDGEPFDTRVDLSGVVHTWSGYATDTLTLGRAAHVTLSGRYNRTTVRNSDRIQPGGGAGSLDGEHVFSRFNPAAGVTMALPRGVTGYAGYSEGSRAATSIELGCADPEEPCKLPNAMAGDPPLEQVVTRTVELGVRRGLQGPLTWNVGWFRAENRDDILFVTSEQTGFGYFKNFGRTRRQGIEVGASTRFARITAGAGYTFLDATYQSAEEVNGESNSTNEEAEEGVPGVEGTIEIAPGDRIPLIPQHMLKLFADIQVTPRLSVDLDLVGMSGSFARGNENNRHEADGKYYLGPGRADGYAVVNLGMRFQATSRLQLTLQVNNLFNRDYVTAAQLGPAGFTATGNFIARPFAAVGGQFPLQHSTFFAPGAPTLAWGGVRVRF